MKPTTLGRGCGFLRASLVLALAGLVFFLWVGSAVAQSYESALLDGVAARDRALETQSERDWQRAMQHFARAVQLNPTKEAQFELAEAAAHIGLVAEAYRAYESALAAGLSGKAEARAQAFIAAHAAELARLQLSGPNGAALYVDEQPHGVLPLAGALVLAAGSHDIRLERAGFHGLQQRVELAPGSLTPLSVTLTPLPVPEPAQPAASPNPASQGPNIDRSPRPAWAKPTFIGGAVLFGVGAVGFVTAHVLLADARQDLEQRCSLAYNAQTHECARTTEGRRHAAQSAANRAATFENLRIVAGGAAAVGLLAGGLGLVQLITSDEPEQATLAGATLEVSSEQLSIRWQRHF